MSKRPGIPGLPVTGSTGEPPAPLQAGDVSRLIPDSCRTRDLSGLSVRPRQVVRGLLASLLPAWCTWVLLCALALSGIRTLPTTPILEDAGGNFLCEAGGTGTDLGYWDARVSPDSLVARCFVALEDRRFWLHPGVDPWAFGRAVLNNLQGYSRQGASTIAMQVVRLQHPAKRTFWNKGIESLAALMMVTRHGKQEVLWQYLRLVPQGNRIHGVAYAARRYFQKPLADLSLAESVMLTTLSRFPGRFNLFSWKGFEAARKRSRLVLDLLLERGEVSRADYASALRQLSVMPMPVREARAPERTHFVLRALEVESKLHVPGTLHDRTIRTSMDPAVQELCQEIARRAIREQRGHGARNLALLVADRKTGKVLGYMGSESYFDSDHAGAINYARTPRSSGSTLKPFIYALGLDSGVFSPASVLADLPFSVFSTQGEYRVSNFDTSWLGPMLYRRALANSRNIPALRVLEGLGAKAFWDLLVRLGLPQDDKGPDWYGYGMILGGIYVTLEDLVAAYGTLASDGGTFALQWFEGSPRDLPADTAVQAGRISRQDPADQTFQPPFSRRASRTLLSFLSDNEARSPSFPRLNPMEYPFPVAVKTGTSQGYRDAWTVAVSDRHVVGMWMGNPDNQPTNHVAGLVCAKYVQDLICSLEPEAARGIGTVPFLQPEDSVPQDLCLLSGGLRGPYCPGWSTEWMPRGQEIRDVCQVHRRVAVDRRTGKTPDNQTRGTDVGFQIRTVLPVEYALWASRQGYESESGPVTTEAPRISMIYPQSGARYLLDPDTPPELQTIPLQARVVPSVARLVWTVNGTELARPGPPYETRLTLRQGTWRIQARLEDGSVTSDEAVIVVE